MKALIIISAVIFLSFGLQAGPFVGGGNGAMPLAYCNSDEGDFGATVNVDYQGKLTGYSWISNQSVSKESPVKLKRAVAVGTPKEIPLSLTGKNFQIKVYMGNLPAQIGAPFDRGAEVIIKLNGRYISKQLNCTFFRLESL